MLTNHGMAMYKIKINKNFTGSVCTFGSDPVTCDQEDEQYYSTVFILSGLYLLCLSIYSTFVNFDILRQYNLFFTIILSLVLFISGMNFLAFYLTASFEQRKYLPIVFSNETAHHEGDMTHQVIALLSAVTRGHFCTVK